MTPPPPVPAPFIRTSTLVAPLGAGALAGVSGLDPCGPRPADLAGFFESFVAGILVASCFFLWYRYRTRFGTFHTFVCVLIAALFFGWLCVFASGSALALLGRCEHKSLAEAASAAILVAAFVAGLYRELRALGAFGFGRANSAPTWIDRNIDMQNFIVRWDRDADDGSSWSTYAMPGILGVVLGITGALQAAGVNLSWLIPFVGIVLTATIAYIFFRQSGPQLARALLLLPIERRSARRFEHEAMPAIRAIRRELAFARWLMTDWDLAQREAQDAAARGNGSRRSRKAARR